MSKSKLLVAGFFLLVFLLGACQNGSTNSSYSYENSIYDLDESQLKELLFEHFSLNEIIEMMFDNNSPLEIIEMRYESYADFLNDVGIPNMFLLMDELWSQGYSEDGRLLIKMMDKIGYSPSSILGDFISDKSGIIHRSDGPCLESIIEMISPIGPYTTTNELQYEITNRNGYLEGYSLCPKCIPNNH